MGVMSATYQSTKGKISELISLTVGLYICILYTESKERAGLIYYYLKKIKRNSNKIRLINITGVNGLRNIKLN